MKFIKTPLKTRSFMLPELLWNTAFLQNMNVKDSNFLRNEMTISHFCSLRLKWQNLLRLSLHNQKNVYMGDNWGFFVDDQCLLWSFFFRTAFAAQLYFAVRIPTRSKLSTTYNTKKFQFNDAYCSRGQHFTIRSNYGSSNVPGVPLKKA